MSLLLDSIHPERLVPDGALILDAGAGDGRLTKPLLNAGYNVRGVELHDWKRDPALPIETGVDFLTLTAEAAGNPTAIITNPPYGSDADRFVRHALSILPDGGEVHALLRAAWVNGIRRADLLPNLHRLVMCRRLNMLPFDREHEDKGYNTVSDFSWYTFRKGESGPGTRLMHPPRRKSGKGQ